VSDHGHTRTPPERGIRCFCSACGMPFDLSAGPAPTIRLKGYVNFAPGQCDAYAFFVTCPHCEHAHDLMPEGRAAPQYHEPFCPGDDICVEHRTAPRGEIVCHHIVGFYGGVTRDDGLVLFLYGDDGALKRCFYPLHVRPDPSGRANPYDRALAEKLAELCLRPHVTGGVWAGLKVAEANLP
jgi:hypothetical protein